KSDLPLSMQRDMLKTISVAEIMTTSVETVEPDTPLSDAAQIMMENKYGCLPVLDGMELVGILTESDFVRFVSDGLRRGENPTAPRPSPPEPDSSQPPKIRTMRRPSGARHDRT